MGGRRGGATQSRSGTTLTTGASDNNAITTAALGAGFSLGWKRSILRENFTLVQKNKIIQLFHKSKIMTKIMVSRESRVRVLAQAPPWSLLSGEDG